MKITRETAESWYRGDEDQNVSAHQVAVFYRGETVRLEAEIATMEKVHETDLDHLEELASALAAEKEKVVRAQDMYLELEKRLTKSEGRFEAAEARIEQIEGCLSEYANVRFTKRAEAAESEVERLKAEKDYDGKEVLSARVAVLEAEKVREHELYLTAHRDNMVGATLLMKMKAKMISTVEALEHAVCLIEKAECDVPDSIRSTLKLAQGVK